MSKVLATAVLVIAVLSLAFYCCLDEIFGEGFSTRREKAQSIVDWFGRQGGSHQYTDYRRDLDGKSNIVEYEDALRLKKAGTLTTDTMLHTL